MRHSVVLSMFFSMLISGCLHYGPPKCDGNDLCQYSTFYDGGRTFSEKKAALSKFSLEAQVGIFMYGMKYRHPPSAYIGDYLMGADPEIIPILINSANKYGGTIVEYKTHKIIEEIIRNHPELEGDQLIIKSKEFHENHIESINEIKSMQR